MPLSLHLLLLLLLLLLEQKESCLLQQLRAKNRQLRKRGVKANRFAAHVPIHFVVMHLRQLPLLLLLLLLFAAVVLCSGLVYNSYIARARVRAAGLWCGGAICWV